LKLDKYNYKKKYLIFLFKILDLDIINRLVIDKYITEEEREEKKITPALFINF